MKIIKNIQNPIYYELKKLKLISDKNLIKINNKIRDKKMAVFKDKKEKVIFLEKFTTNINYYSSIKYKDNDRKIIQKSKKKYKYVKLIRNERDFHIYTFAKDMNGNRFEPDYILVLEDDKNKYQIFIEPKGDGGIERDKWKNEFLRDITISTDSLKLLQSTKADTIKMTTYETEIYKILGLPFYNEKEQDLFSSDFEELLL